MSWMGARPLFRVPPGAAVLTQLKRAHYSIAVIRTRAGSGRAQIIRFREKRQGARTAKYAPLDRFGLGKKQGRPVPPLFIQICRQRINAQPPP